MALLAQPAFADVTPEEVWEGFRSYLESVGYTVTASRAMAGDTLVITGLTASQEVPETHTSFVFEAGDVSFEDLGDGTVLVLFPNSMPIRIDVSEPGQPPVMIGIDYTHSGLELVASGTADDMQYDLSADALGLRLDEITVAGESLPPESARTEVSVAGLTGTMGMAYGALIAVTQDLQAMSLSYDMAFTDPDSGDSGEIAGTLRGLKLVGESDLPQASQGMDMFEMMAAGLGGSGTMSYESGQAEFSGTDGDDTFEGSTSSSKGVLEVAFEEEGFVYDISAEDVEWSATLPDFPFPVSASMGLLQVAVDAPLSAAEEPQDFGAVMQLVDLEIAPVLWSIFDPGNVLPRDPATLILDLAGTATLFESAFDVEAMAEAGEAPGEINSVTINEIVVSAAGAELTGQGGFTFDNSDMETFDGFPAPEGEARLLLRGGNALIDKLIELGVMKPEDAMGARMMLSMFSVPGEGEDSLTSTITVRPDGQVLANGQRIR